MQKQKRRQNLRKKPMLVKKMTKTKRQYHGDEKKIMTMMKK